MAPAALKLHVQQQGTAVSQGNVEHLVYGERLSRQLDIERTCPLDISLEQPCGKIRNKSLSE